MKDQKFYVYLIRSKNGLFYVGQTCDLHKRLSQHNDGISTWTKRDREWNIVHSEEYPSRREALIREKYLKSGQGRAWLKNLLSTSNISNSSGS